MGDLKEAFKEYNEAKRELRDEFVRRDMLVLSESGLAVRKMDGGGYHLRIADKADFWPTTGTWMEFRGRRRGTGIESLLRFLGVDVPVPEVDLEIVQPTDED